MTGATLTVDGGHYMISKVNLALDIQLFILLTAANGTPVIAQNLFGQFWAHPLDGGLKLRDGQPLFGASKTVRGILLSMAVTTVAGVVIGLGWQIALLVATTAMAGDLASSFIKRRMRLPPSSMAIGLDQVPESLVPLLVCAIFFDLSMLDVMAIVACFFASALGISRFLYGLHLRNRPY